MNKILEYQKVDGELNKFERDIQFDKNRKELTTLQEGVKNAQVRMLQLEKEAENLLNELNKLKEVQQKGISVVEKLSKVDLETLNELELKDSVLKIQQTNNQLKEVENRLSNCGHKINSVLSEFQNAKNKIFTSRKKHAECKVAFEQAKTKLEPQMEKLKKQLISLESGIDKELLKKYKAIRQENIFPVFVPLMDNRCGGCRMELSTTAIDKIKANNSIVCDHCRRIIYDI